MDEPELTELQRITLRLLSFTFDYEKLQKGCPLDHGRHVLKPIYDLGSIAKLPTELQDHVLSFVDLESLVAFRRVNQYAMVVVNGMVEYNKVSKFAPNCIRMALAIGTAATFTIKELFTKLCQRRCDGPNCTKLAPYLDVFQLSRRCLSLNGGCPVPLGPFPTNAMEENLDYNTDQLVLLRKFRPILGHYSSGRSELCLTEEDRDIAFYDYSEIRSCLSFGINKEALDRWDLLTAKEDPYWRLCSAVAPWLNKLSFDVERGVFCDMCQTNDVYIGATSVRQAIAMESLFPDNEWEFDLVLSDLPFMRLSELEEHVKEHEGEEGHLEEWELREIAQYKLYL